MSLFFIFRKKRKIAGFLTIELLLIMPIFLLISLFLIKLIKKSYGLGNNQNSIKYHIISLQFRISRNSDNLEKLFPDIIAEKLDYDPNEDSVTLKTHDGKSVRIYLEKPYEILD